MSLLQYYPLVNVYITMGKSPFFMGQLTIFMAIFNSYVGLPTVNGTGCTVLAVSGRTVGASRVDLRRIHRAGVLSMVFADGNNTIAMGITKHHKAFTDFWWVLMMF